MVHDDKAEEEYLNRCSASHMEEQSRSLAETDNWAHVDKAQVHQDWDALYKEMATHIDGSNPDDAQIQAFIKRHFDIASRFYTPSKEAYIGLGLFYASNKDMRDFHNSYHPQMVNVLGESMQLFAEKNL